MSRPIIGITAAAEPARWAVWDTDANVSQQAYSRAVAEAGGLPILIPSVEELTDEPGELVELLLGLVLAGGSDIDPSIYGTEPDPLTGMTFPVRDRFELELTGAALKADLPILGVCRGAQLLNLACGGTLIQHLESAIVHQESPGTLTEHEVRLEPASLAERAAGADRLVVRSHHHQGIADLGAGLSVSGHSLPDDAIEAIEMPGKRFVLGLQWHPEESESAAGRLPIAALVDAARERVAA